MKRPRRTCAPAWLAVTLAATTGAFAVAGGVAGAAAPTRPDGGVLPAGIVVREVWITGNRRVEDATIRAALETAPGKALSAGAVRDDVRRLFALGLFEDVAIEMEGDPALGRVVVSVVEKPLVRAVLIDGNEALDDDKLREVVDVRPGELVDGSKLRRSAERIREKYVEEGYALAEVSVRRAPARPGEVDVVFSVAEAAKVTVRAITFVGNVSLTDAELKACMGTTGGDSLSFLKGTGKLSTAGLEHDLEMLKAAYYDVGYLDAKVARPRVTLSGDRRDAYVTITIDEGRRYRVGKVDVAAPKDPAARDALPAPLLKAGAWFSRTSFAADVAALTRHYRDLGFAYVRVVPRMDLEKHEDPVCK
ncbi:MAG TPA: POTRA domain-containing protein [Myxococcota bacterium]|nr:POTRA domain-containing protein [Myxococcota bacterium]